MKTGFLITRICAALALAGCASPDNGSGVMGNQTLPPAGTNNFN